MQKRVKYRAGDKGPLEAGSQLQFALRKRERSLDNSSNLVQSILDHSVFVNNRFFKWI